MKSITVLIPTKNREIALAATLTSLLSQTYKNFNIIISDQSENFIAQKPSLQTLQRIFAFHDIIMNIFQNLPQKGIAQQRQFLLDKTSTKYCLFLDDDCILEPYVIDNLMKVIKDHTCGFVGQAPIGLSFIHDTRPQEQQIEMWHGKVKPEFITPKNKKWKRYLLHNAANIFHLQNLLNISSTQPQPYKVAWIGGCVLYDTQKLMDVGGFSFWKKLPNEHVGEDALVQQRIMNKFGGCGILPSGVYHQELPTTIPNRQFNAPDLLI